MIATVSADPEVLKALLSALEAQPDSTPLRLHVAGLLLSSGAEAQALDHFAHVLSTDPDNEVALAGATAACTALGDEARATIYRARLAGLRRQGESAAPVPTESLSPRPTPPPVSPGRPGDPAEPVPVLAEGEAGNDWWDLEAVSVTWADVGGMEDIKRKLTVSLVGPIRNPELREAYGKALRGGLLLYGPPGCGKTFIARATAGELRARFIAVGLADILDMWLGQSEKAVQKVFEVARRNAPCVLFFDELDAIGQKRTHLRHTPAQRGVVNQLLSEMDGFGGANDGVFVLGATNHPWDVDSALLRPGRFDRVALVVPPDRPARAAILQGKIAGRPIEIDVNWMADRTDGFSGADLGFLVEVATEAAIEDSLVTGKVRQITKPDFDKALKEVKPSTRAWFESARNFVMFANEGGVYDDLLAYMKSRRLL